MRIRNLTVTTTFLSLQNENNFIWETYSEHITPI